MQTLLYILSILLIINALLLFFSVNRNGTKTPKDQQEPLPISKRVEEEQTDHGLTKPYGTTILRNIKKIEQEIKAQNKKREQEPIGEGHNSIG
jgi:hypothetical protein